MGCHNHHMHMHVHAHVADTSGLSDVVAHVSTQLGASRGRLRRALPLLGPRLARLRLERRPASPHLFRGQSPGNGTCLGRAAYSLRLRHPSG